MHSLRLTLARHPILKYVAAVLFAVLAQVARIPIVPPTQIPYITYVPFILVSAWLGGTLPGLLTGVLSMLEVAYFAVEPGHFTVTHSEDYLGMGAMAVTVLSISVLVGRLNETAARLSAQTKELKRSNDDLQAYAYSVSHDLQEPLRNVSMYVELLNRKCASCISTDSQRLDILEVIGSSAKRMSEMLSSLLLYSRATNNEDTRQWIDSGEVVANVVALLQPKIDGTGALVAVQNLPRVYVWRGGLERVVQNLLDNALKYRSQDRIPNVTISCASNGSQWIFCVADNGIGFDQQYADGIFGVFKRLHAQGTYEGTGIGLAIVRRIVSRNGGTAWAQSSPGQGSSFFFTIPKVSRGA